MMGHNVLLCPQGNVLLEKDRPQLTNGLKVRKKWMMKKINDYFHNFVYIFTFHLAVGHILNDAA